MTARRTATTNGTTATTPSSPRAGGRAASWVDDRLGLSRLGRRYIRKVFPDHWSFLLGEIALWSFVVLLITGIFLTLWFDPSMAQVEYRGSYEALHGVPMSAAYASTLDISFDVRGGLLVRQIHHWATHTLIASMMLHLLRHALTGSFRKPREINWVIGCLMLLLATLAGWTGYSLPDDLLSGTGLRVFDGFLKSVPVVGTYLSFLVFGGEVPGDQVIPRLYIVHVLLIPGLLVGLVVLYLLLGVHHKHAQWPGPGRAENNVVGYPLFPGHAAKAGGFFFIVFGVVALMGGLMTINPLWKYGPYDPAQVTAGSQPAWYLGWPDGLLRLIPPWETQAGGYTIAWGVFLPVIIAPMALWVTVLMLPFVEAWLTGDKREHHLLQRPRDVPTRTAVMVALVTFYGLAWLAGGNDVLAHKLHLSFNQITYTLRVLIFVGPAAAFLITRRWCISLQRHDTDLVQLGYATGVIDRSPAGGYTEKHLPIGEVRAHALTSGDRLRTSGQGPELGDASVSDAGHS